MEPTVNKFQCGLCGKLYQRKCALYSHIRRIHNSKELSTQRTNIVCPERGCEAKFFRKKELHMHWQNVHSQLRMHVQNVHSVNVELEVKSFPTYKGPSVNKIQCDLCGNLFKGNSALNFHMRRIHNLEGHSTQRTRIVCPESACEAKFFRREELRMHVQNVHSVNVELEVKSFPTYKDFVLWKEHVEKETRSFFVKQVCREKSIVFCCHRSGIFSSKSTGKRKLKSIGSKKINGLCTSSMDVKINDTEVQVHFWKTHFKHDFDISHLFLTKEQKCEIADKLQQGISYKRILDDVRDSEDSNLQRIHLLSRKDLNNISSAFALRNKANLMQDHVEKSVQTSKYINNVSSLKSLSTDFLVLLQNQDCRPDVELKCGDYIFRTHGLVLSACSKVISAMLKSNMSEGRTDQIELKGMKCEVSKQFITFLYTKKLPDLNLDSAKELYEVGNKYDVTGLIRQSANFLEENLTPENACDMLVLADTHSDGTFKENIIDYVMRQEIPLQDGQWLPFCENHPKLGFEVFSRFCKFLLKKHT